MISRGRCIPPAVLREGAGGIGIKSGIGYYTSEISKSYFRRTVDSVENYFSRSIYDIL